MFNRCFAALVTPFRDGQIDVAAIEEYVDHLLAGGVTGLVPCGTTGESPCLSAAEQQLVIQTVVKRARGKAVVIAGAGTNNTDVTLELAQAAVRCGADGVMLVAPYYNRPNQRGLYEHFSYVAQAVRAPVVLYNIPGRAGVEIAPDTIARLRTDHSNIVAVKHATGSVDGASELAAISDIAILSGDDTLTLPLMSIGATGVVSVVANLLPRETSRMVTAALAGDWPTARELHFKLFPIARELMKLDTNPIPIKTALASLGLMSEEFRLPLCRMEPAQKEQLRAAVDKMAINRKTPQNA